MRQTEYSYVVMNDNLFQIPRAFANDVLKYEGEMLCEIIHTTAVSFTKTTAVPQAHGLLVFLYYLNLKIS